MIVYLLVVLLADAIAAVTLWAQGWTFIDILVSLVVLNGVGTILFVLGTAWVDRKAGDHVRDAQDRL